MFVVGAAAPNPEVSKGLRDFGFLVIQGYGITECSPIVALNRDTNFRDDAAGQAMPNRTRMMPYITLAVMPNTSTGPAIVNIFALVPRI